MVDSARITKKKQKTTNGFNAQVIKHFQVYLSMKLYFVNSECTFIHAN